MSEYIDYVAFSGVSLGASYNSPTLPGRALQNGSLQLIWTGSPTGDFTIQVSNQLSHNVNGSDVTEWTTLSSSTQAAGGTAGNFAYNFVPLCWRWLRLVYTSSSGTGALKGTYYITAA